MQQLQKEGDTQRIFSVDELIDAFISRQSFAQFRLSQSRKKETFKCVQPKIAAEGYVLKCRITHTHLEVHVVA